MSASKHDPGYESQKQIHQALGHSLRIELLRDLLEDGPMSASRFAKKHELDQEGLSRASYHLKVLAKNDLAVLKERIPRRGSVENVYEVNGDSPLLSMALASVNGYSKLGQRTRAGTLLRVVHLDVDGRGTEEVQEAIREFRARLDQAGTASRQRLDSSAASGKPLQVVYTDVDSESTA
jgi:DNA-binding transcriptional ArsR family regulator